MSFQDEHNLREATDKKKIEDGEWISWRLSLREEGTEAQLLDEIRS